MVRVLVVDDSATDRRLVAGLLERKADWSILHASDGKEALTQLELHIPDLVITDLIMPEMSGLELARAVKRDYPLIPVILMTAKGNEEIAVEALRAGAASYVPKRRLAQDLLNTSELVLAAAHEDRTLARLMHSMTESESVFVLHNDPTLISSLADYLQQMLRCMQLVDETDRLRIRMALEAALDNALYHGNLELDTALREADREAYAELARQRCREAPYKDRRIRVKARVSRSQAVYVIADDGLGFDRSRLALPDEPADLDQTRGRGTLLMQMFMDEVSYNDAGNQVTLVRRRPQERPQEETDETWSMPPSQ